MDQQLWALWRERLVLFVQRFIHHHAHRFTSSDSLSDSCVSISEVRALFAGLLTKTTQNVIDALSLRTLGELEKSLALNTHALESFNRRLEEDVGAESPIQQLQSRFKFSDLEISLLMAAAGAELDVSLGRLYTMAWVDFTQKEVSVGWLAELVSPNAPHEALLALSPSSTLRSSRLLIESNSLAHRPGSGGIHTRLHLAPSCLEFLLGQTPRPSQPGVQLRPPQLPLDLAWPMGLRDKLALALRRAKPVALVGPRGCGRRTTLQNLLGEECLFEVDVQTWLNRTQSPHDCADLCRDAALLNAALLLRLDSLPTPWSSDVRLFLQQVFTLARCPVVLTCNDEDLSNDPNLSIISFTPPPPPVQADLWNTQLTPHIPVAKARGLIVETLTAGYQLHGGQIVSAVAAAASSINRTHHKQALDISDLVLAVRGILEHELAGLAQVIQGGMTLDDVVLTPLVREQLLEIQSFARERDRVLNDWGGSRAGHGDIGLSALFSGPPGTGKTLCATAIGHALGRVVYRVDLSRVVDKYIGETEKRLDKAFREAHKAQAVLLFDEADALFAKRTSVKSSNDRYANLEVNFLLQRVESFSGICILTTNLAESIDDAFKRRLRFHVEFPVPSASERALLWERLLPPGAPRAPSIAWGQLGQKFDFSGGHIRNAALRGAFFAAGRNVPVSTELLLESGLREARARGELLRDVKT